MSNAPTLVPLGALACLAAGAFSSPALAQDRDMSTDRPDKTESAYTVPAGRWQLEMDVANWTKDEDSGTKTEALSVAAFNLKYGIGPNTDIQFVVTPYSRVETKTGATKQTASGFDDLTVRVKQNIFGNDEGPTALAIMPFLTFPTADSDFGGGNDVTGGIIVPYAISISETVGVGLMAQVNALKNSSNDYAAELVLSGTIGMDLTDQVGLYTELFASKFDDDGEKTAASFDAGLTFSPQDDLQFDVGANIGLNDAADDTQIFVGVSRRW